MRSTARKGAAIAVRRGLLPSLGLPPVPGLLPSAAPPKRQEPRLQLAEPWQRQARLPSWAAATKAEEMTAAEQAAARPAKALAPPERPEVRVRQCGR